MRDLDLPALADSLREAARVEIMPRWRRLEAGAVAMKSGPADLVTEADTAAERLIHERMRALLPGALFVGEESVAADPGLLGQLAAADLAVVVDPIDGTANFVAGLPLFAVMAAIVRNGETIAGLIYDPFADDCAIAEGGAGARLLHADGTGKPVHAAAAVPLAEMIGAASMALLPEATRRRLYPSLAKVRVASAYRCAGHEYRAFATGHLHFLFYAKLMPWDHLAGCLIAREAGAYAAKLDGSPYRVGDLSGGLLVASDRAGWMDLRNEVFAL